MASCEKTVAIAVIGVSGSGKSTFINLASGSNLPASKSLGSCTTELKSSTFSLDGRTVTLIDTPGFNDTTQNVLGVLKLINDSFSGLHSQGVKLAGVIYMHRIAEDYMAGPSRHNFHIFRKFCGDTGLRDVFIVTNRWPREEEPDDSEQREHECAHKDEFFRPAIDKGARMLHHDGSQTSAHAILRHLIDRNAKLPHVNRGSLDQKTNLTHTTGGVDAVRELTGQIEHHAKVFGEVFQEIGTPTLAKDETREALREKAKNTLDEIERLRYDLEHMVTNFATENSRLEDENRRYRKDFSARKAEDELRARLLDEERRAWELAQVKQGTVEAQPAEGRASWEHQRTERENLSIPAGPKYDKLFVCGALVFALVCASRFI